jgi:hypothetical protein
MSNHSRIVVRVYRYPQLLREPQPRWSCATDPPFIVLMGDHRSVHSGSVDVEHRRDLYCEDKRKWNSDELMSLKRKRERVFIAPTAPI